MVDYKDVCCPVCGKFAFMVRVDVAKFWAIVECDSCGKNFSYRID